jgi:hypothetical protein
MNAATWRSWIPGAVPRESPKATNPAMTPPPVAPASITAIAVSGRLVCRARWKQKKAATPPAIATNRNGELITSSNPAVRAWSASALVEPSSAP